MDWLGYDLFGFFRHFSANALRPGLPSRHSPRSPAGPKVDGITLRPLLEKADRSAWPERTLFTHNPIDATNKFPGAVRTQRYRLVREIKGPAGGSKAKADDASATPWQLYDMEGDPSETKNIAADHPDIVKQLSARYDAWFADISREGLQRFPLPVGHAENNPVELHAPQAFFDKSLQFASGAGFANDWLTGWTDVKGKVWFNIEVATAGDYDIELALACPPADAGSRLRISVGGESLETTIAAAPAREIPLPHRDEDGKTKYRNRDWTTLKIGTLKLPKGPAKLTLELRRLLPSRGLRHRVDWQVAQRRLFSGLPAEPARVRPLLRLSQRRAGVLEMEPAPQRRRRAPRRALPHGCPQRRGHHLHSRPENKTSRSGGRIGAVSLTRRSLRPFRAGEQKGGSRCPNRVAASASLVRSAARTPLKERNFGLSKNLPCSQRVWEFKNSSPEISHSSRWRSHRVFGKLPCCRGPQGFPGLCQNRLAVLFQPA